MNPTRSLQATRSAVLAAGTAAVLALAGIAGVAGAQQADHARHGKDAHATHGAPGGQTAAMTDGEVRRVDREAGKLTIRHGEIRNLDMPPMTMVFRVADPAMLEKAAEGAKIRFAAEKRGSDYVVTAIEVR